MEEFKVSVIIPVYNAEKYVEKAVLSALELPETGEIILIEDCSPDNSLVISLDLAAKHSRVKLLQHADKGNHGAGASRNLGLENATYPYIAFLDADDYYLFNRFRRSKQIFMDDPSIDGVYEPVGTKYYDSNAKEKFISQKGLDQHSAYQITKISGHVAPGDLFNEFVKDNAEQWHTNAITFEKELLKKTGMFSTSLKLHQDTLMWFKMAYYGKIVAGETLKPVAMVGVHKRNRILTDSKTLSHFASLMYKEMFFWIVKENVERDIFRIIFKRYLMTYRDSLQPKDHKYTRRFKYFINFLRIISNNPQVLLRLL
ncbi:MAG: capsular biosynthesis protein CpsI [Bacteroidetes bacterium]|nr:MAG: capsular biosynthesis protein CpsI [Bacteroidota bacterium]